MAERLADGDLLTILRQMKADGDTFVTMSKRLYADHGIDVSAQTVANWWAQITKSDLAQPEDAA